MQQLKINITILLLFGSFFSLVTNAQSPNHFNIGQEELSNIDVYTIYNDTQNDVLHIGTNDGLFRYVQNKFQPFPIPKGSKSRSFFDLKTNSKGELFCFNLNGQIFKFNKNKWELYFETKEFKADLHSCFVIDKSDKITFVTSQSITKILDDGKTIDLLQKNKLDKDLLSILTTTIKPLSDNSTWLSADYNKNNCWLQLKNDSIFIFPSPNDNASGFHFELENQLFQYAESFFCPNNIKIGFDPINVFNCIGYGNKGFALHRSTGMSKLYLQGNFLRSDVFFKNRFISNFELDKNETAFLGSFNEGVSVVPKLEQVSHQLGETRITSLQAYNDKICYAGTQDGSLIMLNKNQWNKVVENRSEGLEYMYIDKENQRLFLPAVNHFSTGKIDNDSHLKIVNFHTFFKEITTAKGKFFSCLNNYLFSQDSKENEIKRLFTNDKKIFAINANSVQEEISFSDKEKTQTITFDGKNKRQLKLKKQNFVSNKIRSWNNKSVYATRENGILIFESDRFILQISKKDGLISNGIKQIEVQDDILYILSKGKLQVYDLIKNQFIAVGAQDGIGFEPIQFISVSKNRVWLAEINKVYNVEISDLLEPNIPSPVHIDSVLVNGEKIEFDKLSFNYTQSNFKVYYDYRSLISKKDVKIEYFLKGHNKEWHTVSAFENLIEFQSLSPSNYELMIKTTIGKTESKIFSYAFTILPPFWQRTWFYVLIVAIALFVSWLIFRQVMKRQRKKAEALIEKEKLTSKLISSQLQALRSQMNPHFIFNSLNSIQDMVLEKDTDKTYDSIVVFSRLVRNALIYSQKEFIFIFKEIEFLENYLQLEKLRLGKEFQYFIKRDFSDNVQIPSMIIQPFVENALLHGLLHKEGEKRLEINFELKENLICTITDNGIGREKSREIKARQKGAYESFSTRAIKERLDVLSKQYHLKVGYTYFDLFENEKPKGTKVVIELPYKEF